MLHVGNDVKIGYVAQQFRLNVNNNLNSYTNWWRFLEPNLTEREKETEEYCFTNIYGRGRIYVEESFVLSVNINKNSKLNLIRI